MQFFADKQTLEALNLPSAHRANSIFGIFNKVRTSGGLRLLEKLFYYPLASANAINKRTATIAYIQQLAAELPIEDDTFATAEDYLTGLAPSSYLMSVANVFRKKITAAFLKDEQFNTLKTGVNVALKLLQGMQQFVNTLPNDTDNPCLEQITEMRHLLSDVRLGFLAKGLPADLTALRVAALDHLLRHHLATKMEKLIHFIYEWDVYISVGKVARQRNLSFAYAIQQSSASVQASAIWHPALQHPVANALNLGMPYTSINVSDNLDMGYSHFYAEVLCVSRRPNS